MPESNGKDIPIKRFSKSEMAWIEENIFLSGLSEAPDDLYDLMETAGFNAPPKDWKPSAHGENEIPMIMRLTATAIWGTRDE